MLNNTLPPTVSLNSTIPFNVRESANAIVQYNFIRPHPSCRSTLTASSSSLKTYTNM